MRGPSFLRQGGALIAKCPPFLPRMLAAKLMEGTRRSCVLNEAAGRKEKEKEIEIDEDFVAALITAK